MGIIASIVLGIIAGWLTGKLKERRLWPDR